MLAHAIRFCDGDIVEAGAARIRLKVSGRARRVSLRLDRATGEILAIAPSSRRLAEAAAFARERQAWIAARLAERRPRRRLAPGMEVIVFGEPCRLGCALGRASLEGGGWEQGLRLPSSSDAELFGRAAVELLRARAMVWFGVRLARHCEALGVAAPKLALTGARTRWGSCTPGDHGRAPSIRLSWRLALAPPEVADYVAAHECAHLLEANHSRRFWAVVERLVGDPSAHRRWLRAQGPALHAFDA